ncbi:MAG: hypothetical protein ACFFAO_13295 [Candidatus Hermodarchaeota archaeon]
MTDEKPKNLLLKWNDNTGQFEPIKSDHSMDEGIFIELKHEENQWRYFYIRGASLISRRTALRAANGIARTGFVHPGNGRRYGVDSPLEQEISPFEDMPGELRKSQRWWYKGDYKQF